jgi:ADP-heptose:LPS heptosyltransferase
LPINNKPQRILVYRPGQIGDTVVALPAMWAVREHFSSAHICLLTGRHPEKGFVSAVDVLPNEGLFDDCITYPTSIQGFDPKALVTMLPEIRRHRFDTLVYLAPRIRTPWQIRRDLLFFRMAGIKNFVGNTGIQRLERSVNGDSLPLVERETDELLGRLEAGGVPVPPKERRAINLRLDADERSRAESWLTNKLDGQADAQQLVAVGAGSKRASSRWPESNFAELGRMIIDELDMFPIVVGGSDDRELGERLISKWGTGVNGAGELSVRQSAAVMAHCRLYVGNDTGTMHLAAASGIPCVAVFSSADWPGRWYPYGKGHTVFRSSVPCEGCRLDDCVEQDLICLRQIAVNDVLAAVRQTLVDSASDSPVSHLSKLTSGVESIVLASGSQTS